MSKLFLGFLYLTSVSYPHSGYVKFDTESVHIICGWIGGHLEISVTHFGDISALYG